VGARVWQQSSNHVRPIVNGTLNATNCASPPPVGVELSGGSPLLQAIHTEGFATGVQIGDLTGTSAATLIDVKLAPSTTGVVISNQWQTGPVVPGFLPTGNIDIFNLDVSGGGGTYALVDNLNNNKLTAATNSTVGYYLFGLNGVMTSAVPETGLINAVDINGLTTAIYSGSASPSFSAGPSGAAVGGGNTLQVGAGTAGNGSHILTAQSGTDTAGTCKLGSIVPASCTVTFHTLWGTAPACIASDQTSASAIRVLPSTTNVIFYGPASDTVAYHCVGNPN
jgi:hypothetical protein